MSLTPAAVGFTPPDELLVFAKIVFACAVVLGAAVLWLFLWRRRAGSLPRPLMRVSLWGVPALAVVYLLGSIGLLILYLSYARDPEYRPGFFWATRSADLYDQIQFLHRCVVVAGIVAGGIVVGVVVVGLVAARPARRARVR